MSEAHGTKHLNLPWGFGVDISEEVRQESGPEGYMHRRLFFREGKRTELQRQKCDTACHIEMRSKHHHFGS